MAGSLAISAVQAASLVAPTGSRPGGTDQRYRVPRIPRLDDIAGAG